MARLNAITHPLKPINGAANEPTYDLGIKRRVEDIIHETIPGGKLEKLSSGTTSGEVAGETLYTPSPLTYESTHYQCLGMHGYTRPDGTWVIGSLEDRNRPDIKVTDFPIEPTDDDLLRVREIQKSQKEDGYILCSPHTIIKLLLGKVKLIEHIQTEEDVGYFRFSLEGKEIWLIAHKNYRDFPKFIAS